MALNCECDFQDVKSGKPYASLQTVVDIKNKLCQNCFSVIDPENIQIDYTTLSQCCDFYLAKDASGFPYISSNGSDYRVINDKAAFSAIATAGSITDATSIIYDQVVYSNKFGIDTVTGFPYAEETGLYYFDFTMHISMPATTTIYYGLRVNLNFLGERLLGGTEAYIGAAAGTSSVLTYGAFGYLASNQILDVQPILKTGAGAAAVLGIFSDGLGFRQNRLTITRMV